MSQKSAKSAKKPQNTEQLYFAELARMIGLSPKKCVAEINKCESRRMTIEVMAASSAASVQKAGLACLKRLVYNKTPDPHDPTGAYFDNAEDMVRVEGVATGELPVAEGQPVNTPNEKKISNASTATDPSDTVQGSTEINTESKEDDMAAKPKKTAMKLKKSVKPAAAKSDAKAKKAEKAAAAKAAKAEKAAKAKETAAAKKAEKLAAAKARKEELAARYKDHKKPTKATCPSGRSEECAKEAKTEAQVQKLFGYRKMKSASDASKFIIVPQSNCRKCRAEHARIQRAKTAEARENNKAAGVAKNEAEAKAAGATVKPAKAAKGEKKAKAAPEAKTEAKAEQLALPEAPAVTPPPVPEAPAPKAAKKPAKVKAAPAVKVVRKGSKKAATAPKAKAKAARAK